MDLGIQGKTGIVCAASKGLGKGCALALAREGVNLVITGRNRETLRNTAREIADATGVRVETAAGDISTVEGRGAALDRCPNPDILVNNAGGPPTGDFRTWERADWLGALDANMLAPIEMIKATIDGMIERRFGRVVNITSELVKMVYPGLGLSTGARAGFTGFVAGVARESAWANVTINNLLPGSHTTERLDKLALAESERDGKTVEAVFAGWRAENPSGRFGTTEEFGATCAFLCSVHAGFMIGQNVLLDGGAYPGTF